MAATRSDHDPFQKMLGWSGAVHALLFTSVALASYLSSSGSTLPPPNVGMVINLGESGPIQSSGGGSPAPPAPTVEPEPEPTKTEPKVVRPTVEQREQLPLPEAPVAKKPRWEKPKQDSGLRGADAASAESAPLKTSAGAPGIGLGGVGGSSAFDQDFEYAYYAQQMLGRIHQHWQRIPVQGTAVVIVRFTILKDGSVHDVEVEQSSGLAVLDRGAVRAVMLADPMPPLPNSYPRDRVGLHLRFTYSSNY
jgi:TonB family protein